MATLKCPHCDAALPDRRSWTQAAMSTLSAAPAVPDMATQVRCESCGRVSAASDLRYTVADRFGTARWMLWAGAAALLIWVFLRFFG